MKKLLGLFLILFFSFPFIHLLLYLGELEWSVDAYFTSALTGSFIQASLSSLLAMALAFVGALGLRGVREKISPFYFHWLLILILLPGFLPPLILILLNLKWWSSFPFGLWGVVIFHIIMSMGLLAVIFERVISQRALGWGELSQVEGVNRCRFIFKGLLPSLRFELIHLFFFVFISNFMSFSVPFLIGGAKYGGVEVFIYEKIFLLHDWGQALSMAITLTVFFVFFSFFVKSPDEQVWENGNEQDAVKLLKLPGVWIILLLPLLGLIFGLVLSWGKIPYHENIWSLMGGTFVLAVGCGLLTFTILSVIAYCFLRGLSSRLLFSFVPPGWMFVGFSLFLLGSESSIWPFLKVIVGLTIIFVPILYRLQMFTAFAHLENQVDVARTMERSWSKIYFQIIWPQLLPMICLLSGIAAFWASGDFAISSVLFQEDISLALRMKSLMLNYRMEGALVLVPILLLVSVVVFSIFQGMGYVCRRKII